MQYIHYSIKVICNTSIMAKKTFWRPLFLHAFHIGQTQQTFKRTCHARTYSHTCATFSQKKLKILLSASNHKKKQHTGERKGVIVHFQL